MKRFFVFFMALVAFVGLRAQFTSQELDSMYYRFELGSSEQFNTCVQTSVPAQYILPEEYADKSIVEREVDTYYSGKKTLRMQQAEDGTYILVDPERCTYTLEGAAKSDLTVRDITSNETLAEHTASFIKNATPKMDADGDWDFFELKQAGVFGFEANDSVDLDTCRFNYIFWLEKDGKWLYSNYTYGDGALIDTVPPVEILINYRLERDAAYTLKVMHRSFNAAENLLFQFDFIASESGRIQFPDSLGVDGYIEIARIPNHALDIHYVMDMTHVYYKKVHGRNSFDGKGAPVYTFVDFNDPVWYGEWTNNAAASGAEPYFVAVGCGTKWTNDLSNFGSFDLLAHEYAHLVVAANGRGGLFPFGEAGALNEAIADCMSVATDMYINGENANWQIADGVTGNGVPNMRDLSNPKMSGGGVFGAATLSYPQPDTYQGENWIDPENMNYDNGGIHFNNGVFNYWFYLLTEGGSGVNDNEQSYEVEGIGIQKTEQLLMHVILNYLDTTMNYSQMRIVSQYAAKDLWGEDSEELQQVHNAWFAVGVADRTPIDNIEETIQFKLYSAEGSVVIDAADACHVDVYNIIGQLLYSAEVEAGFTTIPIANDNSVVIVKVGNAVEKVIVK